MLFERFEVKGLAHYSYAVGCPGHGRIAIVDPRRDVDIYVEFARSHGVRISHVLETHIHADYASGALELARQTGAELCESNYDVGETFEASFPHSDLRDGDSIELGSVRLEALHTPGHTPEHLSFLVYDCSRSPRVPMLMLSGDFLFVGTLGRPDLLGDAETEELSRKLYRSSRAKIRDLPDGLEIHPAHGAGSMCGAGMSGRPQSTLGFERMANPYLDPTLSEEEFVQKIIGASPPFPAYYRRMKRVNAEGPTILNDLPGLEMIAVRGFRELMDDGALVIDLRGEKAFGSSHIPGSFGIGAGTSLSTWASWVVPYDLPILLVSDGEGHDEDAVRSLVRVGLDGVVGFLEGGMDAWRAEGYEESGLAQATPSELHELLGAGNPPYIVDVRNDQEWLSGHLGTATHIMAGYLPDRLEELPTDRQIALICATGYRSTLVGSVLERSGLKDVLNLDGGMNAWNQAGLPLGTPEAVKT